MRHAARTRRLVQAGPRGRGLAVAGSITVHALAAAVLIVAPAGGRRQPPPVYRVELVAAPRPQPQARRAPEVVERPAERPAPAPKPARRTTVAEQAPPPELRKEQREPAPRTTPTAEPLPDVKPSTGGDPATVKVEGQEFPFPEYLRNIVVQVYRRWQRPGGNVALRSEVFFLVHRDGSISNLSFVTRSGNFAFDLEAQGAIEAAASNGAFGALPNGYPNDVLPVSFFFDPAKVR